MKRTACALALILPATLLTRETALSQPGSWAQTQGPPGGIITAVLATGTGTVLAGTGAGVHRSTDKGLSWSWTSATMNYRSISTLVADSDGTVYAGTGEGKAYRSTDDGLSWQVLPGGTSNASIIAMDVSPPGTLWLARWYSGISRTTDNGAHWQSLDSGLTDKATLSLLVENGGFALAGGYTGIFRSTNGGAVWTPAKSGIAGNQIYALARHRNGSLFAGAVAGIFRSTNDGDDWAKVDNGFARSISFDTSGAILAGMLAGNARRSTDGGTTWNSVSVSSPAAVTALTLTPGGMLYAGTGGMGVYSSSDGGLIWQARREGLVATTVNALHWTSGGSLFAGTDGAGLFRTTDRGVTWVSVPTVTGATKIWNLASDDSGKILVATWDAGLLRQSGPAGTWQFLTSGSFYCVATAPGGVFLAGNSDGRIHHSTDYGKTWSRDSVASAGVQAVAIGGDGTLYAGVFQNGVYRSSDAGKTWTQKNTGVPNLVVRAFLVRPGGVIFAGTDGGLCKTTDRGESWTPVASGLSMFRQMLPIGARQIAAVGWPGVVFSSDSGASWGPANGGLWPSEVRSISIDGNGYLYVGTADAGVFKSTSATGVGEQKVSLVPEGFALMQNYPNPFNGRTIIGFQLPDAGWMKLAVVDPLGREVSTLVNGRETAGFHDVTFDASLLPSGVYFYRLQAGNRVETKKLSLVR